MKLERWYDRQQKTWVVQLNDDQGNQIGDVKHVYTKPEALRITEKDFEAFRKAEAQQANLQKAWDLGPREIGRRFAVALQQVLDIDEYKEVLLLNAGETDMSVCHSHDFCDANMVMDSVFTALGVEPLETEVGGGMSSKMVSLWNAAWDRAVVDYLGGVRNGIEKITKEEA